MFFLVFPSDPSTRDMFATHLYRYLNRGALCLSNQGHNGRLGLTPFMVSCEQGTASAHVIGVNLHDGSVLAELNCSTFVNTFAPNSCHIRLIFNVQFSARPLPCAPLDILTVHSLQPALL